MTPRTLWETPAHQLQAAQARLLADLARETDDHLTLRPVTGATPAGDEQRLRGIPAIGRGVAGVINHTKPGWNL